MPTDTIDRVARSMGFSTSDSAYAEDPSTRKAVVDAAFEHLKRQVMSKGARRPASEVASPVARKYSRSTPAEGSEDSEDSGLESDDLSPGRRRDSTSLDEFSGLEDLDVDSDADRKSASRGRHSPRGKPRKPAKRRGGRAGDGEPDDEESLGGGKSKGDRKRRPAAPPMAVSRTLIGKWAVFLSGGESGEIVDMPGVNKFVVRLDETGKSLKAFRERLYVFPSNPGSKAASVQKIAEVARFVPQAGDIELHGRVGVVRRQYATGKVVELPKELALHSGLPRPAYIRVKLDGPEGLTLRVPVEGVRLLAPDHPVVTYEPPAKRAQRGRPSKAEMEARARAKAQLQEVDYSARVKMLPPPSKTGVAGETWKAGLQAPLFKSRPDAAPGQDEEASDDDGEQE